MVKKYWLVKTEPGEFSLADLKARPGKTEGWNGVRNYSARNFLQGMAVGDEVFVYHSGVSPSGVVGLAIVARAAYPDATALDPKSDYHDPKATPAKNPWVMVDVKYKSDFPRMVTLEQVKAAPRLKNMALVRRGRLSVQPVTPEEFAIILEMAGA